MDIDTITSTSIPILRRYGVKRAALFGSAARGEMTGQSDIDLLVEMPHEARLVDVLGLQTELEEQLARPVDVVEYDRIKPAYKPYILASVRPIAL